MTNQEGSGAEREVTDEGGRLDGITQLSGKANFTSTAASITLDMTGGSVSNTGSYKALGHKGDSIPTNETGQDASKNDRGTAGHPTRYYFTAGSMPAPKATDDYTIQFTYMLTRPGHTPLRTKMTLEGTVAGSQLPSFPQNNIAVTLTPQT